MATGYLALVLHAHLPFIRHPEHRYHLEENWFYEACAATYLPLYEVFQALASEGVPLRVTMSFSPPLLTMLDDPLLRGRTAAYLERLVRLGDDEVARRRGDPRLGPLASYYRERFARLYALYQELGGDLAGGFRALEQRGCLELITVAATHGYLPLIREPRARRAQIELAVASHERRFGRRPRGIWLPECGYSDGLDQFLADQGLGFFFVDAHGVTHARPRPSHATFAPVVLPSGVAAFGRDLESSKQVWSADEGYPGDASYRDFYRDLGFDLPLDQIGPYVHPDGIRLHTGYKYHRVTGRVDLAKKELYVPAEAEARAEQHAADFVRRRAAQVQGLAGQLAGPVVVAPYDAELFGHWWFEGPRFLHHLCRRLAASGAIAMTTPSEVLARGAGQPVAELAPSSWGDGGYSAVWLDEANDWIYRHQHHCEARMLALAAAHPDAQGVERRALDQAARELLLLQASDWAFILKTGTATGYARSRIKAHVARFLRLDRELVSGRIDQGWLADLEQRDNIFPNIDYRIYA